MRIRCWAGMAWLLSVLIPSVGMAQSPGARAELPSPMRGAPMQAEEAAIEAAPGDAPESAGSQVDNPTAAPAEATAEPSAEEAAGAEELGGTSNTVATSGAKNAPEQAEPTNAAQATATKDSVHTTAAPSTAATESPTPANVADEPESGFGFVSRGAPRFRVLTGLQLQWHRDPGYELFNTRKTNKSVPLTAEADLVEIAEGWSLGASASWFRENMLLEGSVGGTANARLHADYGEASVASSYEVLPWVVPFVRLGGGFVATQASLSIATADYGSAEDTGYTWLGSAGIGVTFWGPSLAWDQSAPANSVALGLRLEAGYRWSGVYEFEYGLASDSPYAIPTYEPSAGSIEHDAPYVLASLALGAF